MDLVNIEVSAQFFAHLKASFAAGLVVAFPYVIYEIWKFVAPALYEREKKAVGSAFAMSSIFFYLGVAVGYFFVLPVCLQFFMNYLSGILERNFAVAVYIQAVQVLQHGIFESLLIGFPA